MKAKIKETGKEIVVEPYGDEYAQIFPDGDFKVYTKQELEFPQETYWQQVRIDAAIAAMQGMVISDAYCNEEPVGPAYQIKRRKWPPAKIAKEAVAYADFLIAELQKKGGQE